MADTWWQHKTTCLNGWHMVATQDNYYSSGLECSLNIIGKFTMPLMMLKCWEWILGSPIINRIISKKDYNLDETIPIGFYGINNTAQVLYFCVLYVNNYSCLWYTSCEWLLVFERIEWTLPWLSFYIFNCSLTLLFSSHLNHRDNN